MCYSTNFLAKSTFVKFFEKSADPTLGFYIFITTCSRPVGQDDIPLDSKLKGLQSISFGFRLLRCNFVPGGSKVKSTVFGLFGGPARGQNVDLHFGDPLFKS